VELLQAWLGGVAYETHRHDTYTVCVTDSGVQQFDYRGEAWNSLPGQVVVLHPDEPHDGRPGSVEGFGYRAVYVEPGQIAEAARAIRGRSTPLPFVKAPVLDSPVLARAIAAAFRDFSLPPAPPEPLALDAGVHELARGLIAADPALRGNARCRACDLPALERARRYLDEARTRVVASHELEAVAGHSRYELARQFRQVYGTSPYRYLLMRRLELVRARIAAGAPLADVAADAGFADQAHMSRQFKATTGLTPALYRRILRPA
jgi:AraC-like DNA-binding protein